MAYSVSLKLPRHSLVILTKHVYDLTPDLDADNDGAEDAWELANGLDPNQETDGALDLDLDGLNNRHDFLYATNPRSPNQAPRPELSLTVDGRRINFPTVPGRAYQLEVSSDLKTWSTPSPATSTKGATA